MFMVMFVLDDASQIDQILDAWSKGGVTGATIIESTGLHRRNLKRIPMRYSYGDSPTNEKGNTTLMSVVEDENMVQMCLLAIERIIGDLDGPNTGVFSAWPLAFTKGAKAHRISEKTE